MSQVPADEKTLRRRRASLIILIALLTLVMAAFVLARPWRWPFLRAYRINSDSMASTIVTRDHILADTAAYYRKPPQRGDVILFLQPGAENSIVIKRLVAVGGDELHADSQGVWVNGKLLDEPYLFRGADGKPAPGGPIKEVRVPPDCLFVLGDNRENSYDSRFYGCVPVSKVFGRALYIYWSSDHSRILKEIR